MTLADYAEHPTHRLGLWAKLQRRLSGQAGVDHIRATNADAIAAYQRAIAAYQRAIAAYQRAIDTYRGMAEDGAMRLAEARIEASELRAELDDLRAKSLPWLDEWQVAS